MKTHNEWLDEGAKLFGEDFLKWRFKCPACGRVQTPEEFRRFTDQGVAPDTAAQECVGRFTGGKKGPDKCDWAAFGLFRGPVLIKKDNREVGVFEFAP